MLPGATRSIRKMITDIPNRVSSIRPNRRTRYSANAFLPDLPGARRGAAVAGGRERSLAQFADYLSNQTSSRRQPLNRLFAIATQPLT